MIISRLEGGLGNQMFQYAYGLYLARKHSTTLWLETSSYADSPQHGFLLDKFRIKAERVGPEQLRFIPPRYRAQPQTGWQPTRLLGCFPWGAGWPGQLARHKEAPFGFHPRHLQVPDNRFLVGYWQSEQYFPGLRSELLRHFEPRDALSPRSQEIAERIRESNSVVLHVRRGDYVNDPQVASIYHRLDEAYYLGCLKAWAASRAELEVFVFSNDIAWCRNHLDLPWPTHWVDHTTCDTAHEDLWMMSQAACLVIANSTFSWWAAWLNDRPDKVIYAPQAWFNSGTLNGSSIVPRSWTTVPVGIAQAA